MPAKKPGGGAEAETRLSKAAAKRLRFSNIDIGKVRQIRQFKIDYSNVRNLEFVDQRLKRPQSFSQYSRIVKAEPLKAAKQRRPSFPTDLRYLRSYSARQFPKGKVLVLVQFGLYPSIAGSIRQYVRDLAYEGYWADVYRVLGGTPKEVRTFIKRRRRGLVGVLLVGSLPTAWFEMDDDFWNTHAEFPCDLYYMDLDGSWSDPDNDGKFSAHPSGVAPEIWVGRLWTPTGGGNDAALIKDYFSRNHRFRKGRFGCSDKALTFVDDDWTYFGDCGFDLMFPASRIETLTDPATTESQRYKAEINEHRAWAQVCAHSGPSSHSFSAPGGGGWVPASYLRDVNPPNAYFYNLFACSNALFTQPDYMGGWYIFDKAAGSICNGLAAVGSTKTGSMLLFENFYGPMGAGKALGAAYVDWWKALGASHDLGERRWYYGMVLLGDPTLNWWSGVVPTLREPFNGDQFDHFPRRTNFCWDPVHVKRARYNIEIDAFGARASGKWAAEAGLTWLVSRALSGTEFEHMFVGAQRGRWRVRARVRGQVCPWSDWRYFRYTV